MSKDLFYKNKGNHSVVELIDEYDNIILDVGCGAGDNARLIREKFNAANIYGVTYSIKESEYVSNIMNQCFVFDIEKESILDYTNIKFDCIIFSHVLEHLVTPHAVLESFIKSAKRNSKIIVAVPNVLNWRYRIKFLLGEFNYTQQGILDYTHLRFFTHNTAAKMIFSNINSLEITKIFATGHFPLSFFRKVKFLAGICNFIDKYSVKFFPNLFGEQTIIVAMVKFKNE